MLLQVEAVARVCAQKDVPHMINNAYGVQSAVICKAVTRACRVGRVDAVVQSTDKNFMVPVGGSLVFAPSARPSIVHDVAKRQQTLLDGYIIEERTLTQNTPFSARSHDHKRSIFAFVTLAEASSSERSDSLQS